MRPMNRVNIPAPKLPTCPVCQCNRTDELSDAKGVAGWICRSCGRYWARSVEVTVTRIKYGTRSFTIESTPGTQIAEKAQPTDEWVRRIIGEKIDEHLKRSMYGIFVEGKLS